MFWMNTKKALSKIIKILQKLYIKIQLLCCVGMKMQVVELMAEGYIRQKVTVRKPLTVNLFMKRAVNKKNITTKIVQLVNHHHHPRAKIPTFFDQNKFQRLPLENYGMCTNTHT